MIRNYVHTTADRALPELLADLQDPNIGSEIGSRAGRTLELMHVGITLLEPWKREILCPGRKPSLAAQIAETMWVLAGRSDIDWLSHYLPRARDFSDDGETWRAGYGQRLRKWPTRDGTGVVDQFRFVYEELARNRTSRRAVMSIWDPEIDTADGKDIPCNDWLSFSSRLGKLDLHVAVRSNDAIWGWSGINAFEWSALLEVMSGLLGVGVGSLHFSTTSFHLYDRHWGKADRIVNWSKEAGAEVWMYGDSPRFNLDSATEDRLEAFDDLARLWFVLEKKIREGVPVDVNLFPEPMLQSWLRVLQWWWSGDEAFLEPLKGTRLYRAAQESIQPQRSEEDVSRPATTRWSPFALSLVKMHTEKHAAYGDSWKKRGEIFGILPNLARKVDRLGKNGGGDTAYDTAADLLVYLAKYRCWLTDEYASVPLPLNSLTRTGTLSDGHSAPNEILLYLDEALAGGHAVMSAPLIEDALTAGLERLEQEVMMSTVNRGTVVSFVDDMLIQAFRLARHLYEKENLK